jgi:predicted nucleic acid-binding protein
MIAIDTNVVVRYLTGDHPEQSPRARDLIDGNEVFVPVTVILETAWVLRSAYDFGITDLVRALRAFGGLPSVTIEDAEIVAEALDRTEQGLDLADALHLGRARHCDFLASFDRKFAQASRDLGIGDVRTPG